MAGELSCKVCEVGLRIVCAVRAVGAVSGSVDVVGMAPGLVGVSAMP